MAQLWRGACPLAAPTDASSSKSIACCAWHILIAKPLHIRNSSYQALHAIVYEALRSHPSGPAPHRRHGWPAQHRSLRLAAPLPGYIFSLFDSRKKYLLASSMRISVYFFDGLHIRPNLNIRNNYARA
ncbi:hypothetical protein V8Z74_21525 [Comamonas sp. w2-DMI]|uniref:hypothetical protein n=1 Tax=Comamonas sp. w2-DMI TaxID=3126391 RepID=UPI0032E3D21F